MNRSALGLPRLVESIAALRALNLALTTNGFLFAKHAQALRDAGLRRVTLVWIHWRPIILK